MKRLTKVPSYRHHRQSGQAIVTLVDPSGRRKDVLLGRFGSSDSRLEYARVIAEWEAGSRCFALSLQSLSDLTVNKLRLRFWPHVEEQYRQPDGTPTCEVENFRYSLKPLRGLYGHTPATKFGPLSLKAVRQRMIVGGLSRNLINQRISRITRAFKWAVGEELIPATIHHGLRAVTGLQMGRCEAEETDPVLRP